MVEAIEVPNEACKAAIHAVWTAPTTPASEIEVGNKAPRKLHLIDTIAPKARGKKNA